MSSLKRNKEWNKECVLERNVMFCILYFVFCVLFAGWVACSLFGRCLDVCVTLPIVYVFRFAYVCLFSSGFWSLGVIVVVLRLRKFRVFSCGVWSSKKKLVKANINSRLKRLPKTIRLANDEKAVGMLPPSVSEGFAGFFSCLGKGHPHDFGKFSQCPAAWELIEKNSVAAVLNIKHIHPRPFAFSLALLSFTSLEG